MSSAAGSAVRYRHTQVGYVVLGVVGVSAALIGWLLVEADLAAVAWGVVGSILLVSLLFGWMTVEVRRDDLRFRIGIWLVRRAIPLSDVASVRAVRNRWWYGWGHSPHPRRLAMQRLRARRRRAQAPERGNGRHREHRAQVPRIALAPS